MIWSSIGSANRGINNEDCDDEDHFYQDIVLQRLSKARCLQFIWDVHRFLRLIAPKGHEMIRLTSPRRENEERGDEVHFYSDIVRILLLTVSIRESIWKYQYIWPAIRRKRQTCRMIMRSRMFVLTLAMKFKADFIDKCSGLVTAFVVARTYVGFRVDLAGHQGICRYWPDPDTSLIKLARSGVNPGHFRKS